MDAQLLLCKAQVATNFFARWYGKPGSVEPFFNKLLDLGWVQVQQATSIEGVRHALHYTGSIMRTTPTMLPSMKGDSAPIEIFDYQARALFSAETIDAFMAIEEKAMAPSRNRFSLRDIKTRKIEAMAFALDRVTNLAESFIENRLTNIGSRKVDRVAISGEALDDRANKIVKRFGLKGLRLVAGDRRQQEQWLTKIEQQMADASRTLRIAEKMFGLHGSLTVQAGPISRQSGSIANYNRFQRIIRCGPESGFRVMLHEWVHALDHHVGSAVTGDWVEMASNTTAYVDRQHPLYPAFVHIKKNVHDMMSTANWDVLQRMKDEMQSSMLDAMWSVYAGDSWNLQSDERRHKLCDVKDNQYLLVEVGRDLATKSADASTMRWLVSCLDRRAKEYPGLDKQSRLDEASMFQRLHTLADAIHFLMSPGFAPTKLLEECLLLDRHDKDPYYSKASEIWARHWQNLDLSPIAVAVNAAVSTTPTTNCDSSTVLRDVIGYVIDHESEYMPRDEKIAQAVETAPDGMSL